MRNFKAFLRWLIRWSPAVALTAAVTYFSTTFGVMPVLQFFAEVFLIFGIALVGGTLGAAIAIFIIYLFEMARAWIYE